MQIIDRLNGYCSNAIPMHMPGHKRNTDLSYEDGYLKKLCADVDITEIDGFDNLNFASGIIRKSEEDAALLWNSRHTYYTVNGSTSGILSALFACTVSCKRILAARNCHKSVYNAIRIHGLDPVFIMPEIDSLTGACGHIDPENIENALSADPGIKTVIITSPTYEGIISDIRDISEVVHRHGAVLIVDEAHGPHLGLYGVFPENALSCGADIVIQSLHKTLPSLTGTAVVHVSSNYKDKTVIDELERALTMFSTSSPSYLLISSIDSCVALMKRRGEKVLKEWSDNLFWFYNMACNLKNLKIIDPYNYSDRDPSKIIITGMNGSRLADILRNRYSIEVEMAAPYYVLAMTGAGDTRKTISLLYDALKDIDNNMSESVITEISVFPEIPQRKIQVNQAYKYKSEIADSDKAIGEISSEYIWSYPPGIPVIVPGEKITENIVEYISFCLYASNPLYSDRRGIIDSSDNSFLICRE